MQATVIYTGRGSVSFPFNIPCKDLDQKDEFADMVWDALNNPESHALQSLKVRSMSIGDLILFPDATFYVAVNYGWRSLGREEAIEWQKTINSAITDPSKREWAIKEDFAKNI